MKVMKAIVWVKDGEATFLDAKSPDDIQLETIDMLGGHFPLTDLFSRSDDIEQVQDFVGTLQNGLHEIGIMTRRLEFAEIDIKPVYCVGSRIISNLVLYLHTG